MSKKKKKNKLAKKREVKSTNAEVIEKVIYIFQFCLFILSIIGIVAGLFCLLFSMLYGLDEYYKTSSVTIILSIIILINYFTFGKFKEVRKKYSKKENYNDNSRKN